MAELKKCPFCRSGVAKIKTGSPFMWEHAIECADCGASTKIIGAITPSIARKRAIEAWNNRVTEAEIRAKAISDTIEAIKEHTKIVGSTTCEDLEQLAEQLKDGTSDVNNKCFARGCDHNNLDSTCMYEDASKMSCQLSCYTCEYNCKKTKGDIACKNYKRKSQSS